MSLLQELKHNGSKVKETEGLFFKSPSANRVILKPGKYICLYSDNISLIIPKVSSGQTIAITTESAKEERALTSDSMEYLELVSGGIPAVGKVTNIWKVKDNVKEPVDLSFHSVGGGVYIYTIEITLANL